MMIPVKITELEASELFAGYAHGTSPDLIRVLSETLGHKRARRAWRLWRSVGHSFEDFASCFEIEHSSFSYATREEFDPSLRSVP